MFACVPGDDGVPQPAGCLCHSPGFARLNAHLTQKFLRRSFAANATMGAFAAGAGSGSAAAPAGSIVFTNVRVFDGKSDQLIDGLRVLVDGKTIRAVEPAASGEVAGARVLDCGGRVLMPG